MEVRANLAVYKGHQLPGSCPPAVATLELAQRMAAVA